MSWIPRYYWPKGPSRVSLASYGPRPAWTIGSVDQSVRSVAQRRAQATTCVDAQRAQLRATVPRCQPAAGRAAFGPPAPRRVDRVSYLRNRRQCMADSRQGLGKGKPVTASSWSGCPTGPACRPPSRDPSGALAEAHMELEQLLLRRAVAGNTTGEGPISTSPPRRSGRRR